MKGERPAGDALRRPDFPRRLFDLVAEALGGLAGRRALELGSGAGQLARGLARRGAEVVALDRDRARLEEAHEENRRSGLDVPQYVASAEDTGLPAGSFDLVAAGGAWEGFERPAAAREALRLVRPGGALLVAHFDWLPLHGSIAAMVDRLLRDWNHAWSPPLGEGRFPAWRAELEEAGWPAPEVLEFDVAQPFRREDWLARVRASAGALGMDERTLRRFDEEHGEVLDRRFPEDVLVVPHRLWALLSRRP